VPNWFGYLSDFVDVCENLVMVDDVVTPSDSPVALVVATLTWPSVGVKPNTWKSWGFGVLRDSRMFRARQQGPKHLALGCSWCH